MRMKSIAAEGLHGVNGGGAAGWDQARGYRCEEEEHGYGGEEERVAGAFADPFGGELVEGDAEEQAGSEPAAHAERGGGEHDAEDVGGSGAEGQADAKFAGASGDAVGDDAVEADGGEGEREYGENSKQCVDEALLRILLLAGNPCVEIAHPHHLLFRIDLHDLRAT